MHTSTNIKPIWVEGSVLLEASCLGVVSPGRDLNNVSIFEVHSKSCNELVCGDVLHSDTTLRLVVSFHVLDEEGGVRSKS